MFSKILNLMKLELDFVALCAVQLGNGLSLFCSTGAVLNYLARRYYSAICCSKMSLDAFLSEGLEKFAAALRECVCL